MNSREFLMERPQAVHFAHADAKRTPADGWEEGLSLRPSWHVLYALVGAMIVAFAIVVVVAPTEGWRTLAEYLGSGVMLGVIGLWIRANRSALAIADATFDGEGVIPDHAARSAELSHQRPFELDGTNGSRISRSALERGNSGRRLLHG